MTEPTCNEAVTAAYRASLYVKSLALTNYRNYTSLHLNSDARPAVLLGPNGAGKTNLMEAISLLAPGRGLRRATYSDLPRSGGPSDWAVSATLNVDDQDIQIGTGVQPGGDAQARSGRIVRINGVTQSGSGALADYVEMVWLTPALDGLFTGPAAERRRFLDRLILCRAQEKSHRVVSPCSSHSGSPPRWPPSNPSPSWQCTSTKWSGY